MLHLVVPAGVDDPARPSGGNRYDRRLCDELRTAGHTVHEHRSDDLDVLDRLPDGDVVLVDGLVACACPGAFVAAAGRLRLGVLLHMVSGGAAEQAVLTAAAPVITTSTWGRERVIADHGLPPHRVHVARPGTDPAPTASGTPGGGALLCVGVVAPHKGHDVLLDALGTMRDLRWRLVCAGSLERDPAFVAQLRRHPVADRVTWAGSLAGAELERVYAAADVVVHPSRGEMYGIALVEALAHGLPVIASDVGGVREAVPGGGVLVPPEDDAALAAALRDWLTSGEWRAALRREAGRQRRSLPTWGATARAVGTALEG